MAEVGGTWVEENIKAAAFAFLAFGKDDVSAQEASQLPGQSQTQSRSLMILR